MFATGAFRFFAPTLRLLLVAPALLRSSGAPSAEFVLCKLLHGPDQRSGRQLGRLRIQLGGGAVPRDGYQQTIVGIEAACVAGRPAGLVHGHCCVKGALHVPAPPTHHSRPNSAPISTSRGPIGPKLARLTLQRAARSVNATVPPGTSILSAQQRGDGRYHWCLERYRAGPRRSPASRRQSRRANTTRGGVRCEGVVHCCRANPVAVSPADLLMFITVLAWLHPFVEPEASINPATVGWGDGVMEPAGSRFPCRSWWSTCWSRRIRSRSGWWRLPGA